MTKKSLPEEGDPCQSKTGPDTPQTGDTSVVQSASEPEIAVKAVPNTPTAGPKTESPILSPEAASSLPSPTSTTTQETANPTIYAPCASDAISPMTPNTMPERAGVELALSATTASPRSSSGKKRITSAERSRELQRTLKNDHVQVPLYQIQLEQWRPFTSRVQHSIDIWGSSAKCKGGEYAVRALQIAATCQTSGLNDPQATPEQRIAIAAALCRGSKTYDFAFEKKLTKSEWKDQWGKELIAVADFFGLGNQSHIKAREVAKRKAERELKRAEKQAAKSKGKAA